MTPPDPQFVTQSQLAVQMAAIWAIVGQQNAQINNIREMQVSTQADADALTAQVTALDTEVQADDTAIKQEDTTVAAAVSAITAEIAALNAQIAANQPIDLTKLQAIVGTLTTDTASVGTDNTQLGKDVAAVGAIPPAPPAPPAG